MQTDLVTLRERVIQAAKATPVEIDDVVLESDSDNDGMGFLRIIIQVKHGEETSDQDLEALLETIEKAIGELDERYPSVRFADAA